MTQTDENSLFLEGEVELYTRAWHHLLGWNSDAIANMLASSVTALDSSNSFDSDRAKAFLSQYRPQPVPRQSASKQKTNPRPVSFEFNNCIYDKDIDKEPIKTWWKCWVKFCYVLKDTLDDDFKFGEVLTYSLPDKTPPFDTKPRWGGYHLIEGTNIYVHTVRGAEEVKKDMKELARYFGYTAPVINVDST